MKWLFGSWNEWFSKTYDLKRLPIGAWSSCGSLDIRGFYLGSTNCSRSIEPVLSGSSKVISWAGERSEFIYIGRTDWIGFWGLFGGWCLIGLGWICRRMRESWRAG